MTDLTTMTPGDILRWVNTSPLTVSAAAVYADLGITNLDDLEKAARGGYRMLNEAKGLVELGTWKGRTNVLLEYLSELGHWVMGTELEHLDIWYTLASTIRRRHHDPERSENTAIVFNEAIGAGRGPNYLHSMIYAADEAELPINTLGFGPGIDPVSFIALAAAGIKREADLKVYLDNGLTIPDVIALKDAGVGHGAVAAAVASGLPKNDWLRLLPGLPDGWFPTVAGRSERSLTAADGMLSIVGGDWNVLRELAHSGWTELTEYTFRHDGTSLRFDKNYSTHAFSLEGALRAARAGVTYAEVGGWGRALTSGKGGTTWKDQALPPLSSRHHLGFDVLVDEIVKMKTAGVRLSWLAEFRACGARSIEDLHRFATAGITGKAAEKIRTAAGVEFSNYRPRRFETIGKFFAAYSAAEAEAEAA